MKKIAIIGSRSFNNFELLEQTICNLYPSITNPERPTEQYIIYTGGAIGADRLAQEFAEKYQLDIVIIPPDWEKYGKSAGMIRNEQIILPVDEVVAFWDGSSKGTLNSIEHAKRMNKILHIIKV